MCPSICCVNLYIFCLWPCGQTEVSPAVFKSHISDASFFWLSSANLAFNQRVTLLGCCFFNLKYLKTQVKHIQSTSRLPLTVIACSSVTKGSKPDKTMLIFEFGLCAAVLLLKFSSVFSLGDFHRVVSCARHLARAGYRPSSSVRSVSLTGDVTLAVQSDGA